MDDKVRQAPAPAPAPGFVDRGGKDGGKDGGGSSGGIRHVFVRDLEVLAHIGVWDHERKGGQRVRINIDLEVEDNTDHNDQLENVVCYNQVVEDVRAILASGHINLVETLAERIAEVALRDRRVLATRVRVEKLDAIIDAAAVGVEIERRQRLA